MPYLGRTSFLLCKANWYDSGRCVNALSRAHFISTTPYEEGMAFVQRVNALSRAHFISTPPVYAVTLSSSKKCQCPISGALHFYYIICQPQRKENQCQCPISGALHFYCTRSDRRGKEEDRCQCPISGALHFYNNLIIALYMMEEVCQCPISGALHFYEL